jgi:putative sterol carrier protein
VVTSRCSSTQGTLRFELEGDEGEEHWFIAIKKGDLAVSRQRRKADCRVRVERRLFNRIASGEVNAMAAALRGAVAIEGDPALLMLFQRLFPGPPADAKRDTSGGQDR